MINGIGQGAGSTMGFGYLVDCLGRDKYIADSKKTRGELIPDELMNHVQGCGLSIRSPEWVKHFSIYGGVGFLNDGKGNDFYYSDGGNCMGSSYFMSLGALVDHEGNDRYIPEKGYGIGSAVHLTNAIFIDRKGNDQYFADYHTGGVGSDRSLGIMIDYEGNDAYGPSYSYLQNSIQKELDQKKEHVSESELKKRINKEMADASYGAALKPKAMGMLIDYKGDDQYFIKNNGYGESCGGVIPPVAPENWSHALLIDLNGNDTYLKKGMKDNSYLKYFEHGVCYDTGYKGGDILKNNDTPMANISRIGNMNTQKKLGGKITDILNPDFFVRYAAIGKIVEQGDKHISAIIDLLKMSEDNDLNRDLIEIVNILIIKKQFEKKHQKDLEKLIHAKDPFVRGFTAHTLGTYRAQDSANALIKSISEENEEVRSLIIWALGQTGDPDAYEVLEHKALNDPSLNCRREAVKALKGISAKTKSEDIKKLKLLVDVLIKCAADSDNSIRTYAASGLKSYIKEDHVGDILKKLLKDEDVYVRRSASKVIIEAGGKEAVPMLIETLKFPSIDTFEFYDHDLIKEIAFYCGVDFSKEKRYLYSTWAKWWDQNGKTVDLERNLSIMKEIKNAIFVKHESNGIEIFRKLLKENPHNIVVQNGFVQFCYDWINYKYLTQKEITPSILKKCIDLQNIIIEVEPEIADHRVKLANLYARLSKFDRASKAMKAAIDIDSENKNYLRAWRQYERLAGDRLE